MYQQFTIANFRGINRLRVSHLERINLLTGKNGSGKTSFLEAVFLFMGHHNPSIPIRLNSWRGIDTNELSSEDLWGWLYHNKQSAQPIRIEALSKEHEEFSVAISLNKPEAYLMLENQEQDDLTASENKVAKDNLVLEYFEGAVKKSMATAWVAAEGVRGQPGKQQREFAIFLNPRTILSKDNPKRFSQLDETGRSGEVVDALKIVVPELKRLSLQLKGDEPYVAADIGIGRLIPTNLLGDGANRLLSFVLAILTCKDGVVLIDEVENGIFHRALPDVWDVLKRISYENRTQLFITTHSRECIQAAHESFLKDNDDSLKLFRLETHDGDTSALDYDRETLEVALESELEIR